VSIGAIGGEGLAERVRSALAEQPHVPDEAIDVSAQDGVVTLEGELGSPDTHASIDAAEAAAHGVRGVVRVEHRLRLGHDDARAARRAALAPRAQRSCAQLLDATITP
jgi:BON domain